MAQHDFEYVTRKEYLPVKKELMEIVYAVQNELRGHFTFQFYWIGSSARNMITRDKKSNVGYDFDLDFYPNIDYDDYKPDQIRNMFIKAINKYASKYGYSPCENSTHVLTIKVKDKKNSRILHSADIAICFDFEDGPSRYIHYNKKQNTFEWQTRPDSYDVEEKVEWIKKETEDGWDKVLELYLYLKDNNKDLNKKSRSLYAEAVSNVYNEYNM